MIRQPITTTLVDNFLNPPCCIVFAIIAVRVISLDLKSSLGFKVLETIYCLKTKVYIVLK
jgi:hypothetical protein